MSTATTAVGVMRPNPARIPLRGCGGVVVVEVGTSDISFTAFCEPARDVAVVGGGVPNAEVVGHDVLENPPRDSAECARGARPKG